MEAFSLVLISTTGTKHVELSGKNHFNRIESLAKDRAENSMPNHARRIVSNIEPILIGISANLSDGTSDRSLLSVLGCMLPAHLPRDLFWTYVGTDVRGLRALCS